MKKIVVLTGAGISKESGLSTFRDSDGLWENYPVMDVASIEGWYRNPGLIIDFYNQRRKELTKCNPNKAHLILAELEKYFQVIVVTQNIDDLHERAGSTHVIHLHGELTKVRGVDDDEKTYDVGYNEIHLGDVSKSGAQLRPHVVWFGESVPLLQSAASEVGKADILIVVGTSLVVYPAAGLVHNVEYGTPIFLVDPQKIDIGYKYYTQIQDVATNGMERLEKILLENYK